MSQVVMFTESYDHISEPVAPKLETIDELSCQLPSAGLETSDHMNESPILVHTDVLDSVFSLNLDSLDLAMTETPMFDELDFAIDGAKVNSKDDWVSLFKQEEDEPVEALDDLLGDDFKKSFDFIPAPQVKAEPVTPVVSMLPTPLLNDELPLETRPKRKAVDHLGCVSYSKKLRSQPLLPVEVNGEDPVSVKRARNTEAARRSRARKMERMGQLELKVEELLGAKTELVSEVDRLKKILLAHNIPY